MSPLKSLIRLAVIDLRHCAASILTVLALAVQILVPSGFMVGNKGGDGKIAIELCTSAGKISAFIDSNGQITETKTGSQGPSQDTHDANAMCAFVGHATVGFVPKQLALNLPSQKFAAITDPRPIHILVPGLGLAAPPPPKTGPPIQV